MSRSTKENSSISSETKLELTPANEVVAHNREYLAKLTDFIPDIIYIYHLSFQRTLFVNKTFTAILGYSQDELLSNTVSWFDIIHIDDQKNAAVVSEQISSLIDGGTIEYEIRCKNSQGVYIWLHNKLTIFTRNHDKKPEQVLVTSHDITYRKALEQKLIMQAYTDHLTGLANRTKFMEILESKSMLTEPDFALLFLDLNRFKEVNDTHGHEIGDKLIIHTAHKLSSLFAHPHVLARLGGDEFTVILDGCTQDAHVLAYINKIHTEFVESVKFDNLNLKIDISIGSVLANKVPKPTPSKLLKLADKSMYLAKKAFYKGKRVPKRR